MHIWHLSNFSNLTLEFYDASISWRLYRRRHQLFCRSCSGISFYFKVRYLRWSHIRRWVVVIRHLFMSLADFSRHLLVRAGVVLWLCSHWLVGVCGSCFPKVVDVIFGHIEVIRRRSRMEKDREGLVWKRCFSGNVLTCWGRYSILCLGWYRITSGRIRQFYDFSVRFILSSSCGSLTTYFGQMLRIQ